jgi:WD40 repeat protein
MIRRRHLPALIPAIGAALAPGARAANEREAPGALMRGTAAFGMRVSVNTRGTAFICGAGAETASPASPVLRAWSIAAWREMAVLTGLRGPAADAAFSPRREEVGFVTTEGLLGLWTPGSAETARQLAQHPKGYSRLVWLPSGDQLLTFDQSGWVRLWDRSSGSLIRSFDTGTKEIQSIALCPQGRYLALASYSGPLGVWDLAEPGREPWRMPLGDVAGLAFHRSSGRLFMALRARELLAWMPDGAAAPQPVAPLDQAGKLAPWGKDRLIVIGSRCGVFDVARGVMLKPLDIGWNNICSLVELPGSADLLVATARDDGEDAVGRFSTISQRIVREAAAAASRINALAVLPNGSGVLTATRQVSLWSASEGRLLRRYSSHENLIRALAVANDSWRAFSISYEERVGVTALPAPGGTHYSPRLGLDSFDGIAASPLNNEFATAGIMSGLVVWDGAGPKLRLRRDESDSGALSVAYAPNGQRLVLGLTDGEVMVYDTRSWQIERRFWASRTDAARAFAFAPDGERLLIADGGSDALIVDFPSGRPIQVLTGHASAPSVVAWSPLGPVIAIGAEDGSVYFWDVGTMRPRHRLHAHEGAVTGAAFSPDGQVLYSTSEDGTLALWRVTDGRLLARIISLRTGEELIVYEEGRAIWTTAPDDHAVWALPSVQGPSGRSIVPRVLHAPRPVAQLLSG